MRKLSFLGGLILFAAVPAMAQDNPKGEVAGNYTYIRIKPGGGASDQDCHGGGGSAAWNANSYFGVVGEFAGCKVTGLSGGSAHAFTYLFGPRLTYRASGKFEPFAEALFGGARLTITPSGGTSASQNGFALAVGGGADYKVTRSVAIRLIQFDYLYTKINYGAGSGLPDHQNNLRIQAGIVFRFGGR
jgi:opacity protein-like surface antigen